MSSTHRRTVRERPSRATAERSDNRGALGSSYSHTSAARSAFLPPQASVAIGSSTPVPLGAAVDRTRSKGEPAAHAPAPANEATPSILETSSGGANPAAGAGAHGAGSAGGGLVALALAFIFLSPGLTQWLRVGTERRPRLLRAGRRERPG